VYIVSEVGGGGVIETAAAKDYRRQTYYNNTIICVEAYLCCTVDLHGVRITLADEDDDGGGGGGGIRSPIGAGFCRRYIFNSRHSCAVVAVLYRTAEDTYLGGHEAEVGDGGDAALYARGSIQ